MSCVWNTIIRELTKVGRVKNTNPNEFLYFIKDKNCSTKSVKCNGVKPNRKQMKENKVRINEIKSAGAYSMSSFDPLLFLVCWLFDVNIIMNLNGYLIKYTNDNDIVIRLHSNLSHCY